MQRNKTFYISKPQITSYSQVHILQTKLYYASSHQNSRCLYAAYSLPRLVEASLPLPDMHAKSAQLTLVSSKFNITTIYTYTCILQHLFDYRPQPTIHFTYQNPISIFIRLPTLVNNPFHTFF